MKFKGNILITDPCYIVSGDLEVLEGFSDYISRNTIYGDWTCFTYKGEQDDLPAAWDEIYFKFFDTYNGPELSEEERKARYQEFREIKSDWLKEHCYGEFCADSGMVCVVYLEEAIKNNPEEVEKFLKECPTCYTIIEDFDGEIIESVEGGNLMLIGSGNKPFYTIQSGL